MRAWTEGRPDEAIRLFEEVLELDPEDDVARQLSRRCAEGTHRAQTATD